MKFSIFAALIVTHCTLPAATRLHEGLERSIENAKAHPTKDNLIALAKEIAGHDKYAGFLSSEDQQLNEIARQELCKIPGHAQYFADLIEEERAKLKPGDYRGSFDRKRLWHFETLGHLPSPETVKVLGTFLADERDFIAMRPIPGVPGDFSPGSAGNMTLAMFAFNDLGLRNPPRMELHCEDLVKVRLWREWYEEIKSGKLAFSFRGQSVEYRFNPDGTWVATPITNPPDDAPKPPPPRPPAPPPAPPAATPVAPPAGDRAPLWPWLLGVALLVLPAAAWFLKTRRRP